MPKGQRHSAEFKFKVAVAALKGDKTLSELAGEYQQKFLAVGHQPASRIRQLSYTSKLAASKWNWSG